MKINQFLKYALLVATMSFTLSCSDIKSRLDDLEVRMDKLEQQCSRMNSDIQAMRSIVDVLNQADFIRKVSQVKQDGKVIGYMLEFLKAPSVTIYNGTDGKDAPRIGIRKDGDAYYWTLGNDWLLDDSGNRICVNARNSVTPKLKIEDNCWWISYDGGVSWDNLGEAAPQLFKAIREDADYVYITLFSGTEIKLPKEGRNISFEDAVVKMICVKHWDTDKNGELSFDEAAAVKSLSDFFQGMGILYFNELAYFTGLENLDDMAFFKSGLQEVTLPANLKSIGAKAFYATPLAGITIPETVETVGDGAFYACRSLEYANIPASFTVVPAQMFAGCWKLRKITLPARTTKIGEQAFHECYELEDVVLPQTLDTLENNAFARCANFTEVVLPKSVRSIGHSCFYGCEKCTHFEFPDHITMLDHMVFHSCHSMETFTVPSKVDTIGWYTFWDCTKLDSLVMKPSVPPFVRTDNGGASTLFKDCPETLRIFVPDVDAYKSDPYWKRYGDMIFPIL